MEQKQILISIILPYYNGKAFIKECIDSILAQTYRNFELIVIDDGSPVQEHTTYLKELVDEKNDARIKYFHKANGGLSDARNFGTNNSSGEYLAFIDQDDMWQPEKLARQVEVITRTGARVVISNCRFFGEQDTVVDYSGVNGGKEGVIANSYSKMLRSNFVDSISIVFNRDLVSEAGYSNRRYFVAPDYEYFLRMSKCTDFYLIKEPLTLYRLHEDNTVKQKIRLYCEVICLLFESEPEKMDEKLNATIQIGKNLAKLALNWLRLLFR